MRRIIVLIASIAIIAPIPAVAWSARTRNARPARRTAATGSLPNVKWGLLYGVLRPACCRRALSAGHGGRQREHEQLVGLDPVADEARARLGVADRKDGAEG
jgi:hypothetical protein